MLEYDQAVPGGKSGGRPATRATSAWGGPVPEAALPGPVQRSFDGRPVLRHAAGPAGGDVCDATGGLQALVLVLDPGGGAGRPGRHGRVQQPLQLLQLSH